MREEFGAFFGLDRVEEQEVMSFVEYVDMKLELTGIVTADLEEDLYA